MSQYAVEVVLFDNIANIAIETRAMVDGIKAISEDAAGIFALDYISTRIPHQEIHLESVTRQ